MNRTIVAVIVTRRHCQTLANRVRECGDTFRYEDHLDTPDGPSLLVACLCPDGHGVAHLPWRGWFQCADGKFDLADIKEPTRTAFFSHYIPDTTDPDSTVSLVKVVPSSLTGP